MIRLAIAIGGVFLLEQPSGSIMWEHDRMQEILQLCASLFPVTFLCAWRHSVNNFGFHLKVFLGCVITFTI